MSSKTDNLLQDIQDLGFAVDQSIFQSLDENLSIEFVNLVASLAGEVKSILNTDENVQPIHTLESLVTWKMEVSSLLKELKCPINELHETDLNSRFQTPQHKFLLLDYLCSEVAVSRIERYQQFTSNSDKEKCILKSIMDKLRIPLVLDFDPLSSLSKICDIIKQLPEEQRNRLVNEKLFKNVINYSQIERLNHVASSLSQEFELRRTMMFTRLGATLQSFSWSSKIGGKLPNLIADQISSTTTNFLSEKLLLGLPDVLAAREDLTILTKISSDPPESRDRLGGLKKLHIGDVPDRGGRLASGTKGFQRRTGEKHNPNNFDGPNNKRRRFD